MSEDKNQEMEEQTTPETQVADDKSVQKPEESAEKAEKKAKKEEPKVAHDDFNWDAGNLQGPVYEEKEFKKMEKLYEATINDLHENEILSGVIDTIDDGDVVLDFNHKSNGVVS